MCAKWVPKSGHLASKDKAAEHWREDWANQWTGHLSASFAKAPAHPPQRQSPRETGWARSTAWEVATPVEDKWRRDDWQGGFGAEYGSRGPADWAAWAPEKGRETWDQGLWGGSAHASAEAAPRGKPSRSNVKGNIQESHELPVVGTLFEDEAGAKLALLALVGLWHDKKGQTYDVQSNRGDQGLLVKLKRRGGSTMVYSSRCWVGADGSAKVVWGLTAKYVLEVPARCDVEKPSKVQWAPARPGDWKIEWIRDWEPSKLEEPPGKMDTWPSPIGAGTAVSSTHKVKAEGTVITEPKAGRRTRFAVGVNNGDVDDFSAREDSTVGTIANGNPATFSAAASWLDRPSSGSLQDQISLWGAPADDDPESILDAIQKDVNNMLFAPVELRADPEFVTRALLLNPAALRHAAPELRGDRQFVLAAVSRDGDALQGASINLQADREVVKLAVERSGSALRHASQELKHCRDMALTAVRGDGSVLEVLSPNLQADREVVALAVASSGQSLRYAAPALRGSPDIVLKACRADAEALQFASGDIRCNKAVVTQAVEEKGRCLKHASSSLQADREVVMRAVCRDGTALQFAADPLRGDHEIVTAAAAQDLRALRHATRTAQKGIAGRPPGLSTPKAAGGPPVDEDEECFFGNL
eukprot:CAMPEP_0170574846 /NCGR_PEP_ID=MMETSP0224-20130122/3523_1 /TAXON_ID=285029 /ORGANISM="Togula jolla, Strain CCCM 725" /LENGTH=643 /DNA_ID=CAMNT_0010897541 /DNA_START=93 /DNA_END=2024 /DNA_ORIENTATION=-